jgi:MFS family permease
MAHRVGIYFAVLQLFFALTWTVYVIYLPRLAEQVGIPKQWVLWILLADQLVFVVVDWLMGVYADRAAKVVGRLAPQLARVTLLSALAFLLLPWLAPLASPLLFLMLTLLWTVTSSALRAPPLVLLDKYASHSDSRWMSSLWLFGTGMAGALAPYLTVALRDADARLPFVLSSVAVAVSAWALSWAERTLCAKPRAPRAPPTLRIPIPAFLLVLLLAGLGYQIHSTLNSPPQYLRFAKPNELVNLTPLFWIGFNLCVLPLTLVLRRVGEFHLLIAGAAVGAAAAWFASAAGSIGTLMAAQLAAGAAWAAVMYGAFAAALALGHSGREGYSSGGMFSMFALAAVARIAVVALALNQDAEFRALLVHAPVLLWAAAALLLALLLSTRRAKPGPA